MRSTVFRLVSLLVFVVLFFQRLAVMVMGGSADHPVAVQRPDPLAFLRIGRLVNYVLPDGRSAGEVRPAIVVKIWNMATGYVNLQVFTDGSNDGERWADGITWVTSILYSEEPKPNTWHWGSPAVE